MNLPQSTTTKQHSANAHNVDSLNMCNAKERVPRLTLERDTATFLRRRWNMRKFLQHREGTDFEPVSVGRFFTGTSSGLMCAPQVKQRSGSHSRCACQGFNSHR